MKRIGGCAEFGLGSSRGHDRGDDQNRQPHGNKQNGPQLTAVSAENFLLGKSDADDQGKSGDTKIRADARHGVERTCLAIRPLQPLSHCSKEAGRCDGLRSGLRGRPLHRSDDAIDPDKGDHPLAADIDCVVQPREMPRIDRGDDHAAEAAIRI